ncbi:MAG: flagellar biosynthesis protein FlhF [Burkholderiaceae bacterium]
MNVKRFFARTSREAMARIRAELGEDAVVLKTRKVNNGVEIMAMADGGEIDDGQALAVAPMRTGADAGAAREAAVPRPAARGRAPFEQRVAEDRGDAVAAAAGSAGQGAAPAKPMSTLTFQQFVRDRLALRKADGRGAARDRGEEPHLVSVADTGFEPSDDDAGTGLLVHPAVAPSRPAAHRADRAPISNMHAEPVARSSVPPMRAGAMPVPPQAMPIPSSQVMSAGEPAPAASSVAGAMAAPEMPVAAAMPPVSAAPVASAMGVPPMGMSPMGMSPMAAMVPAVPAAASVPGATAVPTVAGIPAVAVPTAAAVSGAIATPAMLTTPAMPAAASMLVAASPAGEPSVPSLVDMLRPSTPVPGAEVLSQLREMRGLISSQLSSLAMHTDLQRDPVRTQLLRSLLGYGFSPLLVRKLIARLPSDYGESQARDWAASSLARLVRVVESGQTLLDKGGIYAMTGPTGVGKTTTTAKIAAQFALRHGVGSIGLLTVDAYRIGAQDQLRTFGRLLGVPVHVVHDATGLAEFMNIFMNKKLVLIDTVGVGQRDERVSGLLASLASASIKRLLVLNAAAQVETLDDVVRAYRADARTGVIVSKLDEAVKLGGVADCLIRHRLPLAGMADGQRVPEDWHFPDPAELVRRAMTLPANPIFDLDDNEMTLLLDAAAGRPASAAANGALGV